MTNNDRKTMIQDARSFTSKAQKEIGLAAKLTAAAMGEGSATALEVNETLERVELCQQWLKSLLDGWVDP